MFDLIKNLFDPNFMPHGTCYLWFPEILWLHVGSDALIALSYLMIPATLLCFVIKRRSDLPFPWMFLMFGAFITACGITHLFGIWTTWHGTYGIEGLFKLATAMVSLVTAITLIPVVPMALALRSPAHLERLNRMLGVEIEERQRAEVEISMLAYQDPLTELPNRTVLHDRVRQATEQARRHGRKFALMLLDLDHFKDVNDSYGHPLGDMLLRRVADRVRSTLRISDTLARFGGDEFVVLQTELADAEGATLLAERILGALAEPFALGGQTIYTGVSIGITIFPDDGEDATQLLRNADMALYQAKAEGRHGHCFYTRPMTQAAEQRDSLGRDLRNALAQGEVALVYQTIVNLADGCIGGVEGLARWHRKGHGNVAPSVFIPLAETIGLIRPLGNWVLQEACRQARQWARAGHHLCISVNVSPAQLHKQDFEQIVVDVLRRTGLAPSLLDLEIAENVFVETAGQDETLRRLARLGVKLSIDDFGTGFSSLAYLQRFPARRIKIDRSFVCQIGKDHEADTIVRTIITLAHSLDREVVAEGVETAEQVAFLRRHGCDMAQSYLFSPPVPAARLTQILTDGVRERLPAGFCPLLAAG